MALGLVAGVRIPIRSGPGALPRPDVGGRTPDPQLSWTEFRHDFEDGTFGPFRTGNGRALAAGGWVLDSATAARGSHSVRHDIPASQSNQGYAAYYTMSEQHSSAFVRFAYRQSEGFDNSHPIKVLRIQRDYGTLFGTVMFNCDGPDSIKVHSESRTARCIACNVGARPSPNAFRGQWHWYEFFLDVADPASTRYRLWIDDVLRLDTRLSHPRKQATAFNQVFFGGTLNRIGNAGVVWYDEFAVGPAKFGVPR